MKMTDKEYAEKVEKASPPSPFLKNIIFAFVIGGLICVLGQCFNVFYNSLNLSKEMTAAATSISMIFLGGLFTGFNIYDNLAKYAGAGTIVPITGFANSIVSPAMEFKSEGYILGTAVKMFTIAGPVIVYGIISSVIYGLILFIFTGGMS